MTYHSRTCPKFPLGFAMRWFLGGRFYFPNRSTWPLTALKKKFWLIYFRLQSKEQDISNRSFQTSFISFIDQHAYVVFWTKPMWIPTATTRLNLHCSRCGIMEQISSRSISVFKHGVDRCWPTVFVGQSLSSCIWELVVADYYYCVRDHTSN